MSRAQVADLICQLVLIAFMAGGAIAIFMIGTKP